MGHVINSNEWEQYKEEYGVYSFDTSDLSRSPLINKWDCWFSSLNANGGSVCYDGVFHFINYNAMWYGPEIYYNEISTDTWQQQGQEDRQGPNDWSLIAMASAYDPTTGKVFAFTPTADGTACQISTIELVSLVVVPAPSPLQPAMAQNVQTRFCYRRLCRESDILCSVAQLWWNRAGGRCKLYSKGQWRCNGQRCSCGRRAC